jgi:hypothetical protein
MLVELSHGAASDGETDEQRQYRSKEPTERNAVFDLVIVSGLLVIRSQSESSAGG